MTKDALSTSMFRVSIAAQSGVPNDVAAGSIVGGLTISQIRRRVAMTCTIGYWIGAPFARMYASAGAISVKVRYSAVGMPCRARKSLVKKSLTGRAATAGS